MRLCFRFICCCTKVHIFWIRSFPYTELFTDIVSFCLTDLFLYFLVHVFLHFLAFCLVSHTWSIVSRLCMFFGIFILIFKGYSLPAARTKSSGCGACPVRRRWPSSPSTPATSRPSTSVQPTYQVGTEFRNSCFSWNFPLHLWYFAC